MKLQAAEITKLMMKTDGLPKHMKAISPKDLTMTSSLNNITQSQDSGVLSEASALRRATSLP